MTVAGLLLAAGAGQRFGGPKALASFRGEPLLLRGSRLLREGGCDPVLAVLGAQAEQAAAVLAADADATWVLAPDWHTGMGASLRAGLGALPGPDIEAVVVALVDQPLIGPAAVQQLVQAHAAGAIAAVASYDGKPRNPVLLDRSVWPAVCAAATGDVGARGWLRAHPELVTQVDCTRTGSPADADTVEALTRLEQG